MLLVSFYFACLYDDVLARSYYLGYLETCLANQGYELLHCKQMVVSTIYLSTRLDSALLPSLLELLLT